jgi:asparagine N-glycosylation enzyme membrane subunit Stt3
MAAPHDWSTVYQQNSQIVREQYSASDFAALMQADAARYGQITAVSTPQSPPVIQVDDSGQTYFTVVQTVTYQLNGSTKQTQVTSYYLLEDGDWHFWFSEAPH